MLELPDVSLTMFDGVGDARSARAVNLACEGIRYGEVVYISPTRPEGITVPYRFIQIPRFDYANAMRFQSRTMGEFCTTGYQLSIEWDGYPINPHHWEDGFLDWDYVGAPWPPSLVEGATASVVGNGGCVLRSRRFIEALRDAPEHTDESGDVYWCQNPGVLATLEAAGCRFAPIDVAMRFAFESPLPEIPFWSPRQSFGFHGRYWVGLKYGR